MIKEDIRISDIIGSDITKIYSIIDNVYKYYLPRQITKKKFGRAQELRNGTNKRDICGVKYPLKQIQQKIHRYLSQISLPDYMYGSVAKKNNILNAVEHVNNEYFLSVDLKNYFTNISCHQVHSMFLMLGFSSSVSKTLTQLTTFQGHLPQGAPTSPFISNLVFVKTGNLLMSLVQEKNITFTTYLDDLSFSSKEDFKSIHSQIMEILIAGKFKLNTDKITYTQFNPEITGLFINKRQLVLEPKMARYAKQNKSCFQYLKAIYEANKLILLRSNVIPMET